ncbi:MAG TPA: hypothetical protein VNM40_01280 [Candidatus Paceibacterota bacterium]|nr:hypothetical protein [Candidatus Paceibacterota bacterium]
MPKKAEKGFADSLFESLAGGIEYVIEPPKETLWHTITHKWLSITAWVEYISEDWNVSRGVFLIGLYVPLYITAASLVPQFSSLVGGWILFALPVLAPAAAIAGFWGVWMLYVQSLFVFTRTDPILLEVKMPTDITKSPRAMEQVFANLWIRYNETTFIDRNWYGGVRPYFSFELASFGGDVHFYIWTRRMFKNTIEANLYAQYPEVEVVEAEDYAAKFVYDESVECFVTEYGLDSAMARWTWEDTLDPLHAKINAYTPKTYVDFELDKDPKEEHRVDPFASVIEVLSSINKNEQMWVQMVIRAHLKSSWRETVEAEVEKIRKESTILKDAQEDPDAVGFPRPTWKQTEQIRIMERHLSKLPFEVGFRGIYSAPANKMRGPEYTMMRWIYRPFANPNWMSVLRPRRGHNIFDFAWQDWNGIRYRLISRRFIDAYRRRCFFNYPWITPHHIFSTEVLATLWHPPSSTVQAPGLARIPVAKAEAPANLPI